MRIAYLVLVHGNFEHFKRLLKALDDKDAVFYVHIDKKAGLPEGLLGGLAEKKNVIFVARTAAWWCGWSVTKATFSLIKEAIKGDFDYYFLISGADYPIRPNAFLYDKLKAGGEFLNIARGFQKHKRESRICYYHFDGFDRRNKKSWKTKFFLALERLLPKARIRKRRYPFPEVFFGSTWWGLSRACLEYVFDFAGKNPRWARFFRSSYCADEQYIHTIVGNSEFLGRCRGNLTYTDWSTEPAPAVITKEHAELFKKQTEFEGVYGKYSPFFARKFNDGCGEVVAQIDRELRV